MAIKVSTYSQASNITTGLATINVKVPGTFGGINPQALGFQGRRLVKMGIWFENRALGDAITTLQIKDIDGVYAPAGTVIAQIIDQTVALVNQGITIPPGGTPFQLDFPTDPTNPSYLKAIVPSGFYLVASGTKGAPGIDTFALNVAWDDFA